MTQEKYQQLLEQSKAQRLQIKPRKIKQFYDKTLPLKYKSYRSRAERKQIAFELSVEQFLQLIDNQCIFCNDKALGIDRINSNIGYIISNCQPCCKTCNMMKYIYSTEFFLKHIQKIIKHKYQ